MVDVWKKEAKGKIPSSKVFVGDWEELRSLTEAALKGFSDNNSKAVVERQIGLILDKVGVIDNFKNQLEAAKEILDNVTDQQKLSQLQFFKFI